MRVALVAASYDRGTFRHGESLGLQYLATSLEAAGYEVDVFDMTMASLTRDALLQRLSLSHYAFIGFGVLFTRSLPQAIEIAEAARRACPAAHLSIGGQGTSFVWEEILLSTTAFDSAVCFEGELTIVELVKGIERASDLSMINGLWLRVGEQVRFTGYRSPLIDLDSLPHPRRDTESAVEGQPHFMVLTSRGCSSHCTFCSSGNFGNKYHQVDRWRPRSVRDVIEEIEPLVERRGAQAISFVDDDLLGGSGQGCARARELASELTNRRWPLAWSMECRVNEIDIGLLRDLKDAGLKNILVGLDSGNAEDLKLFCKQTTLQQALTAVQAIRDQGLSFEAGFIMFHPLTSLELAEQNLRFLRDTQLAGYQVLINRLQLYQGSPLIEYFRRRVELRKEAFMFSYNFVDWRTRLLRESLLNGLGAMRRVEERIARIRFRSQTGIGNGNRGSAGTAGSTSLDSRSETIQRAVATAFSAIAEGAASQIRRLRTATPESEAALIRDVDSESGVHCAELTRRIDGLEAGMLDFV